MPRTDLSDLLIRSVLCAAVAFVASAASAQSWPDGPSFPSYPTGPSYPYDPEYGHEDGEAPVSGLSRPVRVQVTEGGRFEWVAIGPAGQSEAVRAAIEAEGGQIIRTQTLGALGQVSQISVFPSEARRRAAEEAIARLAADTSLSWNHLFGFAQAQNGARAPRLYAPTLIGDEAPGRCHLGRPVHIGMIDGPVNTEHPALRGVNVTFETLVSRGRVPEADHGTAVAVLMVGEDSTGALAGFARGARLHAVSVFAQGEETEEASVDRIATAIDRLVANGVQVINMSIAGPQNPALGRAVSAAAGRGVVLVGASGNDQRPVVAWPAAAPEVIAVTAVDAQRRRFRMANTGPEVEFSAPGVDIYAARARGAGYVSGTSFAAPIVTALVARRIAQGGASAATVRAALRGSVQALGEGARNTDFGYGLVRASGC